MKVRRAGEVVIVEPAGYLVGGDETDDFDDAVRELLAGGNRRIVIDCSALLGLNSLAVGTLFGLRHSYVARGGQLVLCGLNARTRQLFAITQLTLVFEIRENAAEAVEALAQVA